MPLRRDGLRLGVADRGPRIRRSSRALAAGIPRQRLQRAYEASRWPAAQPAALFEPEPKELAGSERLELRESVALDPRRRDEGRRVGEHVEVLVAIELGQPLEALRLGDPVTRGGNRRPRPSDSGDLEDRVPRRSPNAAKASAMRSSP